MTKTVYKYLLGIMHEITPVTGYGLKLLLNKDWKLTKEEAIKFAKENNLYDDLKY